MASPFETYLNNVASGDETGDDNSAGFGLGSDGDGQLGYEVGEEELGALEDMGYDVGAVRRKRVAKGRGIPVPRNRAYPGGRPAPQRPMVRVPDKFDRVYGSAAKEAGSAIPEMAVGHSTQTLVNGAAFTFTFTAPQAFVLTGLQLNDAAAGKFRGVQLINLTLSISGQPVGGFPIFGAARFEAGGFNRRLEPIEVDTSVVVLFAATALVDAGSATFEVDVMGTRLVSGLSFATR